MNQDLIQEAIDYLVNQWLIDTPEWTLRSDYFTKDQLIVINYIIQKQEKELRIFQKCITRTRHNIEVSMRNILDDLVY